MELLELNEFLDHLSKHRRYSQATVLAYQRDIKQFYDFIESRPIASARAETFRAWISTLAEKGYKPTSIARKLASLRSFIRYLEAYRPDLGLSTYALNALRAPKPERLLSSYISYNDLTKVFSQCVLSSELSHNDRLFCIILELLYATGIRLSELINIKCKDIAFEKAELRVTGKGNKERIIPLTTCILKLLSEYMLREGKSAAQNEFLFSTQRGAQLYPLFVYRLLQKGLAVISHRNRTNPHTLRHTFATHLLNAGASLNDIKTLLGHESLVTTQKYTHTDINSLRRAYRKFHPRARE